MENDSAQLNETHARVQRADLRARSACRPGRLATYRKRTTRNMEVGELSLCHLDARPAVSSSWELALRRDLLTVAAVRRSYTVAFDRSALIAERHEERCTTVAAEWHPERLSTAQNDARRALGLNPIPDGDVYLVNSALQPVARRDPMSPERRCRDNLERRSVVELRADATKIVGYAIVFDTRSRDLGGFVEVVRAGRPSPVAARATVMMSSRSTTTIPAPCSGARRRR